jgi:predicted transcriptional regulator
MKKNDFLEVHFQAFGDFKKEVTKALSKRKRQIQSKNQIVFESVPTFRNFMTIQKIEVLTTIALQKPTSLYDLAKLVDRDFAAVLRDCTGLEAMGFITLKATNDPKGTKVPQLRFSYGGIIIFLPKHPYQIEFGLAA